MKTVELIADIVEGDIRIIGLNMSRHYLSQFNGERVSIRIARQSQKRSEQQNRWYWGVAIPSIINQLSEQTGDRYSKDDIHAWHLSKVLKAKVKTRQMFGQTIVTYKQNQTSDMTTTEFNNFKDILQKYWAERGLDVPDPESQPTTEPREI